MRTLPIGAAFGHSINSTINNLKFALHLSWPWLVVLLPVSVFTNVYFQLHPIERNSMPDAQSIFLGLLSGAIEIGVFASIAVAWHRYILKDEVPQTIGDAD
jgi:DMSO reductase anchor subunit